MLWRARAPCNHSDKGCRSRRVTSYSKSCTRQCCSWRYCRRASSHACNVVLSTTSISTVHTSAVESYTGSSYPVIDAYRKCIDACRSRVARTCGRSSHWTSDGMAASDSGAITHEAFLTLSKKSSKTSTQSFLLAKSRPLWLAIFFGRGRGRMRERSMNLA